MKVVNVLDVFGTGGGKSGRCMKLIMGLDALGYEQMVIVLNQTEIATHPDIQRAENVRLEIIEKNRIGYVKAVRKVFRLLNEFHPDVVQVWGPTVSASIIGLYASTHHYFKYIGAYIADCLYPRFGFIAKVIHAYSRKRCDAFVGNSQAALDSYKVPKHKQVLIYNGFVPRLVPFRSKEEIMTELGLDAKYIISMVAVMRKEKDYDTFLQCAQELCGERNDVAFLCIGRGPQEEMYREKVKAINEPRIQVLGFRYDVDNYYKASYVTVLCNSIINNFAVGESLSNSILESMAVGTPVLATNYGGTPEIINDGKNGYLLRHQDVAQLKGLILQLIEHPEEREKLSTAAEETIRTKFEINRMVNEYIELFNRKDVTNQ